MGIGSPKYKLAIYLCLIGAIGFGFYVRLRNIDATGLWLDEAFSVSVSDPDNGFFDVYRTTLSDVHPPFYQILLWVYYHALGFGEHTGRYLSAVIGMLLIPSVFLLGRTFFDERVGVIVAWLVSINSFLIHYSQETRSYALLTLLTVLSFIAFFRCLSKGKVQDFLCYCLIFAALINTHYFGYLPVFAQMLLVLRMVLLKELERQVIYRFALVVFFAVLTVVPALAYTESSFSRDFWISPPDDVFLFKVFLLYFGDPFLASLFAVMLISGLASMARDVGSAGVCRLIVFWGVAGILLPYVCSVYLRPVTTHRNFIFILPAVLLVVAYAINNIRDVAVKVALLIVLVVFSATPLFKDVSNLRDPENPYSRETHMRDVVVSVMKKPTTLPIYSLDADQFGVYFKLLGSPLRVGSIEKLKSDLTLPSHPEEFYFLETNYHPSIAQEKGLLEKYNGEIVDKEEVGHVRLFKVRISQP
ncbi:glycosyltransferase family 39 protein [Pseudomonas triticicola]|uniref:glycosyltransferase family 39 protein n=1 Tax=Pseudomonas triticicola TaxID=2842345 RepID=UPI003EBAA026